MVKRMAAVSIFLTTLGTIVFFNKGAAILAGFAMPDPVFTHGLFRFRRLTLTKIDILMKNGYNQVKKQQTAIGLLIGIV